MEKLSHEEYLAFLLLYAAYADLEMNRDESERILDCIDRDVFIETRRNFLKLNDKQRLDVIMAQKSQYLGTQELVDDTLAEIKNLFMCDHKMLPIEHFYYNFLKKQLKS